MATVRGCEGASDGARCEGAPCVAHLGTAMVTTVRRCGGASDGAKCEGAPCVVRRCSVRKVVFDGAGVRCEVRGAKRV